MLKSCATTPKSFTTIIKIIADHANMTDNGLGKGKASHWTIFRIRIDLSVRIMDAELYRIHDYAEFLLALIFPNNDRVTIFS